MTRLQVPLINMSDIVAICIVLHNICIINNEGIEEDWIIEVESKLARIINEGDVREDSELRGEIIVITKVRRRILARKNVPMQTKKMMQRQIYFC